MATIGIAYITNDSKNDEIVIHKIIKTIETLRPDLIILNIITDSIKIENWCPIFLVLEMFELKKIYAMIPIYGV